MQEFVTPTTIEGTTTWMSLDGELHRTDGPALIHRDGSEYWYQYGELHRLDGPARVANGVEEWFRHGKQHRDDGPAYDCGNAKYWYCDGLIHRANGPAMVTSYSEQWFQNGIAHRLDGPAVIWEDGREIWYRNGEIHRENGPAISGAGLVPEYWVDDVYQPIVLVEPNILQISMREGEIIDFSNFSSVHPVSDERSVNQLNMIVRHYHIDDEDLPLFRLKYTVHE